MSREMIWTKQRYEDYSSCGQIHQEEGLDDYDEELMCFILACLSPNAIEHEEDEAGIIRNYDEEASSPV